MNYLGTAPPSCNWGEEERINTDLTFRLFSCDFLSQFWVWIANTKRNSNLKFPAFSWCPDFYLFVWSNSSGPLVASCCWFFANWKKKNLLLRNTHILVCYYSATHTCGNSSSRPWVNIQKTTTARDVKVFSRLLGHSLQTSQVSLVELISSFIQTSSKSVTAEWSRK